MRERRSTDLYDFTATEPFHQFMASLDDPFARAYVAKPRRIGLGPLESDPEHDERLRRLAPQAVSLYEASQLKALDALAQALDGVDPLPLLCGLMLLIKFEAWGTYFEPKALPNDLDFELTIATVAASPPGHRRSATSQDLVTAALAAKAVRWSAHALHAAHAHMPTDAAAPMSKSDLVLRWLVYRGAAYFPHASAAAQALAGGRNAQRLGRLGFKIGDVIDLADAVHRRWEYVGQALDSAWLAAVEVTGEEPVELHDGSEAFHTAFFDTAMYSLPAVLGVPVGAADTLLGASRMQAELSAMHHLSIRPGSAGEVLSVLAELPQRNRPFLILPAPLGQTGEIALLAHPAALTTDLHLTIDAVLTRTEQNWPLSRAAAVDQHAVALLKRVLPNCRAETHVFLDGPNGREEVDSVVVYEDIVIVVEGKGAPLKLAARRGSVDKLLAQLRELVGSGSQQLERDVAYIRNNNPARFYDSSAGGRCVLEIDPSNVRRYYQLLPCLDGFLDAGTSLNNLTDAGVLTSLANPWIVGVTFLNIVTDVLTRPGEFVGYLDFRSRWIRERRLIIMDEVEMLALYLYQVNLAARLRENPDAVLFHPPSQPLFDSWYDGLRGAAPIVGRPRVMNTLRMRRFIDDLHRRKPTGWLGSVTAAMQVPWEVAEALDEVQTQLAADAAQAGAVIRGDDDHWLLAVAQDVTWDDVINSPLGENLTDAPLTLFLRQKGCRLQLEDVRPRTRPHSDY